MRLPTSTKRRQHRKPVQTRPPRADQDRRVPPNQCNFLRFCVKKFIFFCVNVLHFVQKALCLATQIKRGCSKCGILRHGMLTRQLLLFWVQLLPIFWGCVSVWFGRLWVRCSVCVQRAQGFWGGLQKSKTLWGAVSGVVAFAIVQTLVFGQGVFLLWKKLSIYKQWGFLASYLMQ